MPLEALFKGIVIGASIAAPVGPIGVLCIRRSLEGGMGPGLATGLGAATADAAFGCVAAFGLTAVSGFLLGGRTWLALGGAAGLFYLGVRTFRTRPGGAPGGAPPEGLMAAYGSSVLLTLSNPATILSFLAIFAGAGLAGAAGPRDATRMVAGVFLGSALWWLILSGGVGLFRKRVPPAAMLAIHRLSGCILVLFGLYALYTAVIPNQPISP